MRHAAPPELIYAVPPYSMIEESKQPHERLSRLVGLSFPLFRAIGAQSRFHALLLLLGCSLFWRVFRILVASLT